ncbi:MAG: glycosyltransferase family 2 protein [Planctomycetota bacterium]
MPPSPEPRVTAVMVTYNSKATLPRALAGLKASFDRGLCSCVVVDNDSKDGTADYVRAEHPWVDLVATGENLGFGRGNNRGFARADTEYVLLLNPDAELTPAALQQLIDFLDAQAEVGIVGPAIREAGHPDQPVFRFPTPGTMLCHALGRLGGSAGALARPIEPRRYRVDWLCGAVLLVRRALLQTIQGFDPRFFLYFEETDLCLRARQAGFETWVLGDVVAGHYGGTSTKAVQRPMWEGCIAEHYFKSRHYYMRKHHGVVLATLAELAEMLLITVHGLAKAIVGRPNQDRVRRRWRAPILRLPRLITDEPRLPEPNPRALATH